MLSRHWHHTWPCLRVNKLGHMPYSAMLNHTHTTHYRTSKDIILTYSQSLQAVAQVAVNRRVGRSVPVSSCPRVDVALRHWAPKLCKRQKCTVSGIGQQHLPNTANVMQFKSCSTFKLAIKHLAAIEVATFMQGCFCWENHKYSATYWRTVN